MPFNPSLCARPAGNIMFFDCETTGLPPRSGRYTAPPTETELWGRCRLVQIAWAVHAPDGALVGSECHIVRPEGFAIPPETTAIHGITQQEATEHGECLADVLARFSAAAAGCKALAAHNISFDSGVVQSELYRAGRAADACAVEAMPKMCTMRAGTLPGRKWPRLAELYERCFGERPRVCHRADADVEACARIFFHLMHHPHM